MSDEQTAPRISATDLKGLLDAKGAFAIDLILKTSGEQIPGALRYDPKQILDADPLVLPIPHDGVTVLIGKEDHGHTLSEVVEAFRKAKYVDVRILEGGERAWTDAGFETVELTMKQPVAGAAGHQLFR